MSRLDYNENPYDPLSTDQQSKKKNKKKRRRRHPRSKPNDSSNSNPETASKNKSEYEQKLETLAEHLSAQLAEERRKREQVEEKLAAAKDKLAANEQQVTEFMEMAIQERDARERLQLELTKTKKQQQKTQNILQLQDEQITSLRNTCDELRSELKNSRENIEAEEVGILRLQISRLKREINRIRSKMDCNNRQLQLVKVNDQNSIKQTRMMRGDNERLRKKIASLHERITKLEADNANLQTENKELNAHLSWNSSTTTTPASESSGWLTVSRGSSKNTSPNPTVPPLLGGNNSLWHALPPLDLRPDNGGGSHHSSTNTPRTD